MSEDKVLLFIPGYNCAPQIVRVLRKLKDLPPGLIAEALVLDNRSNDDTVTAGIGVLPEIENLALRVARNRANYGLGGSHKAAFQYANSHGFTHVIVLHGDDQGDIGDIVPILQAGEHRRFDACLGSRFMRGSQAPGYSKFRIFGNRVFNLLFSAASGRRVTDLGSGLNIFARSVFADPDLERYSDDLRFNCYLLLGLVDKRRTFRFFPITWREEDQVSNVRLYSQTVKTLEIVRQYVLSRHSFRSEDHRAAPIDAYGFDIMGQTASCEESHAG